MKFNKTLLDLLLEDKLQSNEGKELRAVLKTKIQEGQLCLEQFRVTLNHINSRIMEIDNDNRENNNLPLSEIQALAQKRAAYAITREIWNFATQVQLISTECKALQEKLYFAETDWEKSNQSRQAYNYMYEYGSNLNKMMGKDFFEMVSLLLGDDGVKELKQLKKPISRFFEKHRENYYSVRNATTAHRDQDSLKQINTIVSSEWSERIQELHEFEKITLPLGGFAGQLIKAGNELLEQAYINH